MDGIRARGSASRGLQLGRVLLVTGGWSARLGVVFFFLTSDTMERSRPHLRLDDAACVYSTPRDCTLFLLKWVALLLDARVQWRSSGCICVLDDAGRGLPCRIRARAALVGQRDASRGDARVQKMENLWQHPWAGRRMELVVPCNLLDFLHCWFSLKLSGR